MTGALTRIDVRGRDGMLAGRVLGRRRGRTPTSASRSPGFPNLFIVQGPGSPSAATNFVAALEQHVEWIGDCLVLSARARATAPSRRCRTRSDEWIEHTTALVAPTVLVHPTCNSWYNGGNVPGKKRMYMGYTAGIPEYRRRCDEIADARLHRVQARVKARPNARGAVGREFAGVLPRAHRRAVGGHPGLEPAARCTGARQLGEVVLDELVVTGMTLTAPPPKLERPAELSASRCRTSCPGWGGRCTPRTGTVAGQD